ncbi:MAG TPA: DUF1269 domain-containing protein [Candidatus Dormibacteraeota bacterium]|nr:DUF1269 domain-containing protein [Candidatus Dormibacteraeota bacterium]
MSDKKLVLAIFDGESAADSAVESLKQWDKADKKVNMSAIGILALDENGQLKTQKMGRRSVRKGAAIGTVLAVVTPIGLAAGVVGGGLLGALHRKGLGLNEEYRDMIANELMDGKAAVGVLTDPDDADQVMDWMVKLGGRPEAHTVSSENLSEIERETAAEQQATPPAA